MTETSDRKKTRVRSPAYPAIDLKAAIDKAEIIYKHEKRTAAPVAVVVGHCGYDIKSSGGQRIVSALKQFGLVSEEGNNEDRNVKLSELALDILLAATDNSIERLQAIKKAAMNPKIHKRLWAHFNGELPSDATLKAYLVRQLEFNDVHVGQFIKVFRSTIAFAKLGAQDIIGEGTDNAEVDPVVAEGDESNGNPENKTKAKNVSAVIPQNSQDVVIRDFPIPLSGGGLAVVKVPVPMSQSDFKQITATLKAWKSALVRGSTEAASDDDPGDDDDD